MLKNFKQERLLVISPHPDDEVIGCGGLIHRVKQDGGTVFVLYMTVGSAKDFSKKGVSTTHERMRELERVGKFLKLDGQRVAFPGDPYHLRLDQVAQRDLVNEIERGKDISLEAVRPTLFLIPRPDDYNQDHRASALAAITAVRPSPHAIKHTPKATLVYEYPPSFWSVGTAGHEPTCFVALSRENLSMKLRAMKLYSSQVKHPLSSYAPRSLQKFAELRGVQAGVALAEAFTIKQMFI